MKMPRDSLFRSAVQVTAGITCHVERQEEMANGERLVKHSNGFSMRCISLCYKGHFSYMKCISYVTACLG